VRSVSEQARAPDAEGPELRLLPAAAAAWGSAGWAVSAPAGTSLAVGLPTLVGAAGLAAWVLRARARGASSGPAPPRPVPPRPAASWRTPSWWVPALAATLACAAVALLATAAQQSVRGAGLLADLVDQRATATVVGRVAGDAREVRGQVVPGRPPPPERVAVRLRVVDVEGRGSRGAARAPVLVLGPTSWRDVRLGETVAVTGRLSPVGRGDDVVAMLFAADPPQRVAPPPGWQRVAEQLRSGLREASSPLPADAGGLLPGLVVGDTTRLPPELEEDMRRVALTHLTAVSGANVAIVCGAVLLAAAAAGVGRRLRLVLAAAALVGFVVLARPDPSVLRAAVMGAIGLLGLATARRGRGVPLLCCAVVGLVAVNPWLSRSYAFVLSVLATGALLLLARPIAAALSRRMPLVAAQAIAIPAAAQLVCGPVVVLLNPELPLMSVPANLLAAPAVAPATVLGVVVTVLAAVWLPAAQVVAWPAGLATGWIALVARTAASLPGATVPWPDGWAGAALLAALTAAGLLLAWWLLRWRSRRSSCARRPRRSRGTASPGARAPTARRRVLVLLALVTALAIGVSIGVTTQWLRQPAWLPADWAVVACDVGQGDALLVRSGPTSAVLVDTGPDPEPLDRCLRDIGVDGLDLLVLTHFHADHVGGVDGVGGRRVDRVLASPLAEPRAQASAVTRSLLDRGAQVEPVWTGLSGTAGSVTWRVLWPTELLGAGPGAANDASVVLLLEVDGLRVVATGDLEPPGQAALRRELAGSGTPLPPVDVLKVAHHGSRHQDEGLHRLLAPRVALVSAGEENTYGHPAPQTLDLLARTGTTVLRTDLRGHLAVGGRDAELWVAGQRSGAAREPAAAPTVGPGTLTPWQQDEVARAGAARPSSRTGARLSRHRSCCSPAPRVCSPSGRWTGSAGWHARPTPRSRSSPSRRRSTRPASSTPGPAPPCSASRGWWSPRGSSRPVRPSSRTSWPTWATCRRTSSSCCGTAAASAARSSWTR